jgi:hypothetical protein
MKTAFIQFLPLLPVLIFLLVVGAIQGVITTTGFAALVRAIQEKGYPIDRQGATEILKIWSKRPLRIVLDSDPDDLRAVKLEHSRAFARKLRLLRLASSLCYVVIIVGVWLILDQK